MKYISLIIALILITMYANSQEAIQNSGTITKIELNEIDSTKINISDTIVSKKEVIKKKKKETKEEDYYTGQCQGITKKGKQCKRNASGGTRYCYQHRR